MDTLTNALRKAIMDRLDECSPDFTPKICKRISTKQGYRSIEKQIIEMIALEGMEIGPAIAQLEVEL